MSDDAQSCKGDPGQFQQLPGLTIMELRIFSCRFIIGSDEVVGAIFCGHRAAQTPYCPEHRALCYRGAPSLSGLMKFE